nr:hypothetical protein GCM10025732_28350 [Glycomyces mayteni]
MAVGAQVRAEPGVHEPQVVQQFGGGPEGAAHRGRAGALAQGQRGRDVLDGVDLGARGLGEAAARVGREGLQVAAGAFGVEDAEREEDFPDPETPATATSLRSGTSTSMPLRLWTLAPRTAMRTGAPSPSRPMSVPSA